MVADSLQVGSIAFLKLQVGETGRGGAPIAGCDEVAGDIDSDDVSAELSQR